MKIRNYLDQLTLEYTQLCQRNDGSIYGIASGKQCRKGTPISYNPNLAKLGGKEGLKQVKVGAKDKVANLVAKAKAIGLSNKDIRQIKEEVKVELNAKKVQGKEAFKLFAKKANEMAKGRRQKDKVEKVTSENYTDYVDVAKKNHKEEIDKIDKLQVEISDKLSRIFGQRGLSLAEKRKLLNEVREGREQVTKEFEKIRTGLLKKGDNKAAKDEAKDLLDSSYDDELPRSRNFYEGEFAKLYRITQNKISTLGELIYADDRAFARQPYGFQPGVINVGNKKSEIEAAMSLWHEFGHHLEYSNPNLKTVATNWLKTRSSGKIRSLNELYNTNEFKADEMAYVGNFGLGQYVGAVRPTGNTEVISMGLEKFYDGGNMADFYKKDPEHFFLILGILDSL